MRIEASLLLEAAAMAAVVTAGLVLAAAPTVLPVLLGRFGPRIATERPRMLLRESTGGAWRPR